MNLRETACENVTWTELSQNSVQIYDCSDGPLSCSHMHACTHVPIQIHTHRQDRQTDTQTHTHMHTTMHHRITKLMSMFPAYSPAGTWKIKWHQFQ